MYLCSYVYMSIILPDRAQKSWHNAKPRVPLHELYSNAIKKQEASVHVIIERTQVNKNHEGCRNPRPCFLLYNFLEHISLIIRHSEFKFDGNSCPCNSIRGYKIATFFHPVQISSNYLIIFWIGNKMSFHWILNVLEKLLIKWVPAFRIKKFKTTRLMCCYFNWKGCFYDDRTAWKTLPHHSKLWPGEVIWRPRSEIGLGIQFIKNVSSGSSSSPAIHSSLQVGLGPPNESIFPICGCPFSQWGMLAQPGVQLGT